MKLLRVAYLLVTFNNFVLQNYWSTNLHCVSYSFGVLYKECLLNHVTHHTLIAFVHVYSKEWKTKLYSKFQSLLFIKAMFLHMRKLMTNDMLGLSCTWITCIVYIYTCWVQHLILCVIEIHVWLWLHCKSVRTESSPVWSLHLWINHYIALEIRCPATKERLNGNLTHGTKINVSSRPRYNVTATLSTGPKIT